MGHNPPYLPTPVVLRLSGLRPSTLDYWVRIGLAEPSVRASEGRRKTRRWSVRDVVSIRALKALHDAGCPHRLLLRAKAQLAEGWESQLRDRHLMWDGRDLLALQPWGEIESLIRQPRQAQLHVVAVPLELWTQETEACIVPIGDQVRRTRRPQGSSSAAADNSKRKEA